MKLKSLGEWALLSIEEHDLRSVHLFVHELFIEFVYFVFRQLNNRLLLFRLWDCLLLLLVCFGQCLMKRGWHHAHGWSPWESSWRWHSHKAWRRRIHAWMRRPLWWELRLRGSRLKRKIGIRLGCLNGNQLG